MNVIVYETPFERARHIAKAMFAGIRRVGKDKVSMRMLRPNLEPQADCAVFYGQAYGGKELLKKYVEAGKHVVFFDLGYWNREGTRSKYDGYHKVALDSLHPTHKQLNFDRTGGDRFAAQKIHVREKRRVPGEHILLAGLSSKASIVYGYKAYEWELDTIAEIKKHTDRPIVYRPKPSFRDAKPINGTIFSPPSSPLEPVLLKAHCVVSRHSNVSVDSLVEGIPSFSETGAALAGGVSYSMGGLACIETATCPQIDDRMEFLHKLAYCQWNLKEMSTGLCWRWYRSNM